MKQTNYHTHTFRCYHASGSDEEYVLEAIRNGYQELGFSDHSCWQYNSSFKPHMRMDLKTFPGYKKSVLSLKNKYKDQILIRFGMETEYYPQYMDWMLDFCIKKEIDYLIFGNHYYQTDEHRIYFGNVDENFINAYFEMALEALDTGMYAYFAHPELILRNTYITWNEDIEKKFDKICRLCKEKDIPLEYNVLGMRSNELDQYECYPHHKFWKLASKYHNKAIIGMDAHNPMDLDKKYYKKAVKELSKYDLEIVDEIKNIDFIQIKRNWEK